MKLPTLGEAFKQLRHQLGLDHEEAASEIGVNEWLLGDFEDGMLTEYQAAEINDQIFDAWGFDLYQFMAAYYWTGENCPEPLRPAAKALAEGCKRHIEAIIQARKDTP
jgi:hypothetical protein